MTFLVIILSAFAWFCTLVFAFNAGRFSMREEVKKAEAMIDRSIVAVDKAHTVMDKVVVPFEQLELIKQQILDETPGPEQGPPGPPGKTPEAKDITMYNGDNLWDWGEAMYERLKRLERRSGMSV